MKDEMKVIAANIMTHKLKKNDATKVMINASMELYLKISKYRINYLAPAKSLEL